MQTRFTERQLSDPEIAAADDILRRCVHCGFCTATCPTYVLTGDERDSPRGRIYLMQEMFEENRVTAPMVRHIDRCLSCLSCMTTCPSGVDYMHLVDMARIRIRRDGKRPLRQRLKRRFLSKVIPDPRSFRFLVLAGWLAKPFAGLASALNLAGIASALRAIPAGLPRLALPRRETLKFSRRSRIARVALLQGCVQEVVRPAITDSAIRLLERHGVEVVVIHDQYCCGAVDHHLGEEEKALHTARKNVDAWSAEMRKAPIDAILVTASGCGTMVKDYGYLLARDRGYADRAAEISSRTRDISEFLAEFGLLAPTIWSRLKVAYHSPCSLQHGQGIDRTPRELLYQAGFRVADIAENHICCGSAGTYSLLQPDFAGQLRERKLNHIAKTDADVVATGNIGCLRQLYSPDGLPVVHTVELLDWATGGPCPAELGKIQTRAEPVNSLVQHAGIA